MEYVVESLSSPTYTQTDIPFILTNFLLWHITIFSCISTMKKKKACKRKKYQPQRVTSKKSMRIWRQLAGLLWGLNWSNNNCLLFFVDGLYFLCFLCENKYALVRVVGSGYYCTMDVELPYYALPLNVERAGPTRQSQNVTWCQWCRIYCPLKLYRFRNTLAVASKKKPWSTLSLVNKFWDSAAALKGRCDIHLRRDLLYNPNSTTKTPENCLYHI